MPLFQGSRTPSVKEVATTASRQSPPAANTSAPISAALRDCATTMPPRETAAGLRTCWALLNWSRILLPSLSFTLLSAAPPAAGSLAGGTVARDLAENLFDFCFRQ